MADIVKCKCLDIVVNKDGIVTDCKLTDGSTEPMIIKIERVLKEIKKGTIIVENITIDENGNVFITGLADDVVENARKTKEETTEAENKTAGTDVQKFERDSKIQMMNSSYKVDYYWSKLYDKKIEEYNLDELDCALEAKWSLEIGDNGSSGFDVRYERNNRAFSSINQVKDEVIRRGYLTEEQFDRYIIGMSDNGGRMCNEYTFAEYICNVNGIK